MVDANTTCSSGETLISWNQTGPQGPQGIQGPPGPTGVPGSGGQILCPGCHFEGNSPSFVGKDLSGADFNRNNSVAEFDSMDLSQVNFSHAYMDGVIFYNPILDNTNFDHVTAKSMTIASSNPSIGDHTNFSNLQTADNTNNNLLIDTDFSLTNCSFHNDNITIILYQVSNGNFSGCDFSNTNLSNPPSNTDFQAYGTHTNFTNTNLTNSNFTNANLTHVTDMNTATLTGAIWSNTTCPDGTNSDNDGGTCLNNLTPAP